MKKKMFLALAISAFICGACASNTQQTAPAKKEIGVQLYSFSKAIQGDYDSTVKKVGKIGFTSVEAAGYKDGKLYGKTPGEFKKSIEDNGMKVLSSHVVKVLSDKELATGDFSESMKWWDQCIAAHKEAGVKYLVMPWMAVTKTVKDLNTYCKYYNEVGKKCAAAGIKFGYHNHAHEFQKVENKVVMYDYMLENTDPKYVFFEMDVYWAVMGQASPVDYFVKFPGRFRLLHIKDRKDIGQSGMVGFDAIFKNAQLAGLEGIVVEIEPVAGDPMDLAVLSVKYLQENPYLKASYAK